MTRRNETELPGDQVRWTDASGVTHWLDYDYAYTLDGTRCWATGYSPAGLSARVVLAQGPVTCLACLRAGPSSWAFPVEVA